MNVESSLWMGDIEPWMNESIILNAFNEYGFKPKNVKLIKDKKYNIFLNYCFINFDNIIEANSALVKLNGKNIPKTNLNFKLNWANKNSENFKNVYVGNLPPKINDFELYIFFKSKYPSVCHTSIVTDKGISKRYGFVHFLKEEDYLKCLKEMDGIIFNNYAIKVKERKKKNNDEEINNNMKESYNNLNKNILNNNINYIQKINDNNINNVYYYKINNKFQNINLQSFNINDIKSFYPKRKSEEEASRIDNDETTFSSQEKEQDLSLSNSSIKQKRKFSDNIELLESNDHSTLNKKMQDSVNKMFDNYKKNNHFGLSKMILYYSSNNNKSNEDL